MVHYEKSIVAYLDFLGFREALRSEGRADKILQLLTAIAAFNGDFFITSQPNENGSTSQLRPAISAFSDNIVISYPVGDLSKHGVNEMVVALFLQNMLGYIAWNAFEARLLVRGGIAYGDLYHSRGVVFGPALVEAFETEHSLANYPRVALAPSILTAFGQDKWKSNIYTHEDGISVLGYMQPFILRAEPGGGKMNPMVKTWVSQVKEAVASEIATHTTNGDLKALSKWHWFKSNLEHNLSLINPAILEMDTPAAQRDH